MIKPQLYDIGIIGGGIVGVATAYKLKLKYKNVNVVVFEKETDLALHQSGRNSGVIHSGVYYEPNSLKAKLCVNGRNQLIDFANEFNIPYKITGKLIVASSEEEEKQLYRIYERGKLIDIQGLKWLNQKEVNDIEPFCKVLSAISVPTAGIIDYKIIVHKLKDEFVRLGGKVVSKFEVQKLQFINGLYEVGGKNGVGISKVKSIIVCAGAQSDRLAKLEGLKPKVRIVPFKGEYYRLKNTKLVKGLIYPTPNPNFPFLGVHFTKKLNGNVECGPNAVLGFDREAQNQYDINLGDVFDTLTYKGFYKLMTKHFAFGFEEQKRSWSKQLFLKTLQNMIPAVTNNDIEKLRFGVRAVVLKEDGSLPDDFIFEETENSLHVISAPSPAATASLAIANYIINKVAKKFEF